LLQSLGLVEALAAEMVAAHEYHWYGGDGELLLKFDWSQVGRSGWKSDYFFFQPELEAALDQVRRTRPSVIVERGWAAEALSDSDSGVELTVRRVVEDEPGRLALTGEVRTVRAAWVVGADGANSFVREASGIARRDLGFRERWLVVDVEPHDMQALSHLPTVCQWCDPKRPTTHVQSGPRHRRWEFMLLPDERPADFEDPARVWSLLEPWYRPRDGRLTRSAVYEFRSMLAEEMRDGHVLLVGDAAHLTPPFLGQGLCSGLRDAANLAWKLDLVLRGVASDRLLDTVSSERQPQNEAIIGLAVELGRILCQLDAKVAAERDRTLREGEPPPAPQLAPLSDGVIHRGAGDGSDPLAGTLSVQGIVRRAGREGLFDDVVGRGFQLIAAKDDATASLTAEHRALIDQVDMTVASLDPGAPNGVTDVDGRMTAWLAQHRAYAVLVRPDFYVFGSAPSAEDLPALLEDLGTQLHITRLAAAAGSGGHA
jgi:2-polyprenyl-6-methoxyphenol hydroxylase-like FAD-dependent oxidoreductase